MTEKMYKTIWTETEKAVGYLRGKECNMFCNSFPCGFGKAHLLVYTVAGANDKMIKHIAKVYPNAKIIYSTEGNVSEEKETREQFFLDYVSKN